MFPALCVQSLSARLCLCRWLVQAVYTLLFESFVLSWLKINTVDVVRKQLQLSWNTVDGIMTRAVKRGLSRIKKLLSERHMNVDKVIFKKEHRYIAVVSDRDGRARH